MHKASVFKRYFLPGFVFPSFVIVCGSRPCSSRPVFAGILLIVGALFVYLVLAYWFVGRFPAPEIPLIGVDVGAFMIFVIAVMAAFFIGFYGLALTDAVYGLLLFAVMFSVLKYLKIPKKSQPLIKLIMYAGIVTFILGIVFGGWAGLTIEQAPAFLTSTNAD
ncbi:MAG: hypothetical protein IH798_04750, partial [Gemmatimonadetes bacterium]|nr:hypothetical protein [Gemmatimonadota bacterium]